MQTDPRTVCSAGDDEMVRIGRAALLEALADVLLSELDLSLACRLQTDPLLGVALRPPQGAPRIAALRSEYARLFLLNVPPYSSIYLDAPAMIGGESARRWEAWLDEQHLAPVSFERTAAPDHAGLVLRALAAASRATADSASVIVAAALRWLPQYLTALERNDRDGFYGRVALMTASVLQECALVARPYCGTSSDSIRHDGPEEESVGAIARWLCTPAYSGLYLSKHDLRRLAAMFSIGVGIVGREQMLEQVFAASGLDARTGLLLDALDAEHAASLDAYTSWTNSVDGWSVALEPWHRRLTATHSLLGRLRVALDVDTA